MTIWEQHNHWKLSTHPTVSQEPTNHRSSPDHYNGCIWHQHNSQASSITKLSSPIYHQFCGHSIRWWDGRIIGILPPYQKTKIQRWVGLLFRQWSWQTMLRNARQKWWDQHNVFLSKRMNSPGIEKKMSHMERLFTMCDHKRMKSIDQYQQLEATESILKEIVQLQHQIYSP